MRIFFLVVVLFASIGLFYLNLSGQGMLYQQSKVAETEYTTLTCKYANGRNMFEVVSRYESWAYPNKTCDFLVLTRE